MSLSDSVALSVPARNGQVFRAARVLDNWLTIQHRFVRQQERCTRQVAEIAKSEEI